MQKVVGVSVSHKIRLSLVTDEGFGELDRKYVGLKVAEVDVDGNYTKIVGLNGADWFQLLGCEVEFSCQPLTHSEALLLGYDPDDESMHCLIDRVFVTKKPTEGTPEQEAPGDE